MIRFMGIFVHKYICILTENMDINGFMNVYYVYVSIFMSFIK